MKIKDLYFGFKSMHITEKIAWCSLFTVTLGFSGAIIMLIHNVVNHNASTEFVSNLATFSKVLLVAIPLMVWPALYCIYKQNLDSKKKLKELKDILKK